MWGENDVTVAEIMVAAGKEHELEQAAEYHVPALERCPRPVKSAMEGGRLVSQMEVNGGGASGGGSFGGNGVELKVTLNLS